MNRTSLNVAGKLAGAIAIGALIGFALDAIGVAGVANVPFGVWLLCWALIGGVMGWIDRRLLPAAAVAVTLLLLVLGATPLVGYLARGWVRDDAVHPPLDAVVVLSSGIKSDSMLDPTGAERLLSGIEAMRRAGARLLVTTRARRISHGASLTTDFGQQWLAGIAQVDSQWSIVDSVFSTRDEAIGAGRLLLPARRRIAVVTSPMHTRRACATFERVGFQVTCIAAREIGHVTRNPVDADDRLAAWRAYLYERLGTIKYRWKGWIR